MWGRKGKWWLCRWGPVYPTGSQGRSLTLALYATWASCSWMLSLLSAQCCPDLLYPCHYVNNHKRPGQIGCYVSPRERTTNNRIVLYQGKSSTFHTKKSNKSFFQSEAQLPVCCRWPGWVVEVAHPSLLWQVLLFLLSQVSFYIINCFLQCLLPGYFIDLVYYVHVCTVYYCAPVHVRRVRFLSTMGSSGTELIKT